MQWMILPLRRYADFRGRSRRMEFWMWVLFQAIVYTVLSIILFAVVGTQQFAQTSSAMGSAASVTAIASFGIFGLFFGVFWLATLLPNLAVQVRRLHDLNWSGWWIMLWAGPLIFNYVVLGFIGVSAASGGGPGPGLMVVNGIISFVGLIGDLVLLVMYCLPGTRGTNRFGLDPLDLTGSENLSDVFS